MSIENIIENSCEIVGNYFIVEQGALGIGYTLGTWSPDFKWEGGTPPVLSTGANEIDIITFISDGTSLYGTIQNNFS